MLRRSLAFVLIHIHGTSVQWIPFDRVRHAIGDAQTNVANGNGILSDFYCTETNQLDTIVARKSGSFRALAAVAATVAPKEGYRRRRPEIHGFRPESQKLDRLGRFDDWCSGGVHLFFYRGGKGDKDDGFVLVVVILLECYFVLPGCMGV